jgi:hypothetical protein
MEGRMRRTGDPLVLLAWLCLLLTAPLHGEPPAAEGPHAQAKGKTVRTDRHGDPLPAKVLVRMGTPR